MHADIFCYPSLMARRGAATHRRSGDAQWLYAFERSLHSGSWSKPAGELCGSEQWTGADCQ